MRFQSAIRLAANWFGLYIRRPARGRVEIGRASAVRRETLLGALRSIKEVGFTPETVIDVGVADGTIPLYSTFPKAHHILVEPLAEFAPQLRQIARHLDRCALFFAVAGPTHGEASINVHADLVGSSLLREHEGGGVNGVPRKVSQMTLDEIVSKVSARGPYLIKVDSQGFEIEVLRGAMTVLSDAEIVVLEVSFFRFFENGPDFYEVTIYMRDRGFVVYDVLEPMYRPLDGALAQADVVFVKENSALRSQHVYATPKQRFKQNQRLRQRLRKKSRSLGGLLI